MIYDIYIYIYIYIYMIYDIWYIYIYIYMIWYMIFFFDCTGEDVLVHFCLSKLNLHFFWIYLTIIKIYSILFKANHLVCIARRWYWNWVSANFYKNLFSWELDTVGRFFIDNISWRTEEKRNHLQSNS